MSGLSRNQVTGWHVAIAASCIVSNFACCTVALFNSALLAISAPPDNGDATRVGAWWRRL